MARRKRTPTLDERRGQSAKRASTTISDLKPIRGARLPREVERAVRSKSTPKVKARKPRAPTTDERRGQSAKRAEKKTVVVLKTKPKRREDKTISDVAKEERLRAQVALARRREKKADTGDILKGTKVVARKRDADGLKKELEGRGTAVKLSGKAGEEFLKSGHPTAVAIKAAGILPGGVGKFLERGVKDLINLPAQAVPSVYVPAAAAVEAAKGDTKRLKQLGKDIQQHDPVYATGQAAVRLAKGDTKGAKRSIKRAGKLASEHPGFTAVEVVGTKGTVGRGVTRVQRAAGKTPTRRAPATLPGTDMKQTRVYSKDAFTRAGQKMTERNRVKRAEERRAEARALEKRDPGRHADRIDELRAEANRIDPRRMKDTEVRKRAAERVAVNEQIRRENRTKVGQEVREAIAPRKGRLKRRERPTAATTLAVQNITDFTLTDLAKYKREIAAQYEGLSKAGRQANRRLQNEIQKAIDAKPDPEALRATAKRYAAIAQPSTQALVDRGMLPAASASKAPLVPYAGRRMAVRITDDGPVDARTGAPITAKEIRAHMKRNNVPEPSYVTQAPGRGGASAFYVSSSKPQSIPNVRRTGAATVKGTFEAGPEVLVEGAARAQGLIDAADGFASTVKEFAHKPTLGKLKTKKDADARARELTADTGVEYRPIRLNPFAGRQDQLKALLDAAGEGIDQPLGQLQPIREALEGAFRGEDGPGPWALVPRAAADEFAAHMQKMGVGPAGKVGQLIGQSFRRVVLSTSPTWLAGNVVEASLRSALAGAGPRSYKLGRDVLARVDEISPKLGQELRARAVGGGHFKSAEALHVRRGAEQFAGTRLEPMARALHKFWQTSGPKQAANVWNRWTDLSFRQFNGRIESAYQTAMLGKVLRDSPLMDPKLPMLSKRAVEQAARGLTNTNEQIAMARLVERMYGKYNGFNAGTRWAIAMYTPFIPWTLNAVKFVFDVLPRDHPTVTGLIAATEQWTEEWRKDRGLDLFIDEAVPGFLQGSIPLKGGAHQRAPHRYTPFGAFGDPLDTAAKAVLPQYQGVLAAFKGEDWKGSRLRNKDGSEMDTLGKAGAAAQSFTEATVPLIGILKRVAQKGPAALNPVNPTKPPKAKARTGRRSSRGVQADIDAILSGGDGVQRDIDTILSGGTP